MNLLKEYYFIEIFSNVALFCNFFDDFSFDIPSIYTVKISYCQCIPYCIKYGISNMTSYERYAIKQVDHMKYLKTAGAQCYSINWILFSHYAATRILHLQVQNPRQPLKICSYREIIFEIYQLVVLSSNLTSYIQHPCGFTFKHIYLLNK